MFQRELDLAVSCGERMMRYLEEASRAPRVDGVAKNLHEALDAAWRLESALGEFLAVEEPKLRADGLLESANAAARAFDVIRTPLGEAHEMTRRSESDMKDWIAEFRPKAELALESARDARKKAPPASNDRISAPIGEATRESAKAVVSIGSTTDRNLSIEGVVDLVREALEPLGGIGKFVQSGQTVLLKPNQTMFILADEGSTTDPRLVAAMARLCFDAGASRVIVGESSGGGSKSGYIMHVTGVKMLAEREGAEVVDFHTCDQREVDVPDGKIFKRALLPTPILDADVVINLPKMKTHNWDWVSGALKNWVGIVRPDVRAEHHDVHTFNEYVDLHFRVPAQLHVMDAIIRGVGNGPGATTGEFYGAVLASTDPVAMDAVMAQILGFDPASIGFRERSSGAWIGSGRSEPDRGRWHVIAGCHQACQAAGDGRGYLRRQHDSGKRPDKSRHAGPREVDGGPLPVDGYVGGGQAAARQTDYPHRRRGGSAFPRAPAAGPIHRDRRCGTR